MPQDPKTGGYYHVKVGKKDYDDYRNITLDAKKGIKAVLGIWEDDDGKHSEVSTYLFDKEKWTLKDAKAWVKKKNSKSMIKADEVVVKAEIIGEDEVSDKALAKAGLTKNKDLLYSSFRLCHANINANKDEFELEDLQTSYGTIKLKPINWEHDDDEIIGTVYDSELIENPDPEDDDSPYVRAFAVVYKYKFPEYAEEMKNRHKEGKLFYSMEVWFETAVCSECGENYESPNDYCEHLTKRFEIAEYSRKLKGLTFGGVGVVKNPADKKADSFSVAKQAQSWIDFENDDVDVMKLSLEDLVKKEEADEQKRRAMYIFQDAISALFNDPELDREDKKSKFSGLALQLLTIYELDDNNSGGTKIMADKAFKTFNTEEEFNSAISNSDKVKDLESKFSDLEKDLEKVKEDLETANQEKEKVQKGFDEYKEKIETDQLIAKRVEVLKNQGLAEDKIDDKLKAALTKLSDEEFEAFKGTFATKDTDDTKDQDPVDPDLGSTKASKNFSLGEFLKKI